MDISRRAFRFDIFKLLIALLLVVLFAISLLRGNPEGMARQPSIITLLLKEPVTATPVVAQTEMALTKTLVPTQVSVVATATNAPTTPPLQAPAATTTPQEGFTETPVASTSLTPEIRLADEECEGIPSRLSVGMRVRVLNALHFRTEPRVASDNILHTYITGTILEVVGGPQCVTFGNNAHLWWELREPNGEVGWSAEGSALGRMYFLQPLP